VVVSSTVMMVEYRDESQRIFAGRQSIVSGVPPKVTDLLKRVNLINCD